jgi:hypothetical protein
LIGYPERGRSWGRTSYGTSLESVFRPLAKKYHHILYVPGNHQYYKASPGQVTRNLAKLTKALPGVVIPQTAPW